MYTNLPCKNVMLFVNIHMKNVNDGDFDTNINRDMWMDVYMIMYMYIDIYVCTGWKMKNDFRDCKYSSKMKF